MGNATVAWGGKGNAAGTVLTVTDLQCCRVLVGWVHKEQKRTGTGMATMVVTGAKPIAIFPIHDSHHLCLIGDFDFIFTSSYFRSGRVATNTGVGCEP